MLAFVLASPLLARFILPLVIGLLEIVRSLILLVQLLIDEVIKLLIKQFFYETDE
jgi:hypothetical protein